MIEITPQAIDQASNRVLGMWREGRALIVENGTEPEGFHTWLLRHAEEALSKGVETPSGKHRWNGMKFEFLKAYKGEGIASPKIFHLLLSVERVR